MIANVVQQQWFVVRGWLDQEEWGDEPPDPDDVWAVGDRVRLKGSTVEGTVFLNENQPFLGGYLPYVLVQWDNKSFSVPIEPDLLVRLTRFIPQGLTWKAEQSFSDYEEMLSVQLQQAHTINKLQSFSVSDLVSGSFGERTILHIHGKKATVNLRNYGRKEQIKLCHLTLIHETAVQLQLQQGTLETKEKEAMVASFNLEATGFKPGQSVYVKKGNKRVKRVVGDLTGEGRNYSKVLTLGGRSGREEYWEDPSKLEAVSTQSETENSETANYLVDEEFLNLIYNQLTDGDVWTSRMDIFQDLDYKHAIANIVTALEELEKRGMAKRILNTSKKEILWQKDVPSVNPQQQLQQPQELQKTESLPSTTFAQEWASVSQQLPSSSEDFTLRDSAKLMTSVEISSASDTPVFQLQKTSELEATLQGLTQELSQLRQVANRLASTENGGEQTMSETSSQHSSISLEVANQNISALRMYEVSSPAPTNPEEPPEDFLNGFSGNFSSAGIMSNGKLSTAQSLELPSLENDSFWLRSPQALSSSSEGTRPPGQSKLEVQLKELGLLGPQEVLNPEFLAKGLYNLPANWGAQSESRAATEILGIKEKHTETLLTPDQLPLPSVTSSELKKPEEELKEEQPLEAVQLAQTTVQKTITVLEQIGEGLHWVDPNLIVLNLGTQSRVETDKPTVKYYAEQMKSDLWEWEASPVGLLWDGEALLPWDGHHRIEAAIAAGKNLLARIQTGDLRRAIALSCGSNKKPSLRRTREDNQKTIEMLEDLRKQHGDEWLLQIINAELPPDKHFKEVSLRAIESYTGIPFSTIRNVQKRKKKDSDKDKTEKIAFTPTPDEMQLIESIMEAEELDKPSEVLRWLLQNYQES